MDQWTELFNELPIDEYDLQLPNIQLSDLTIHRCLRTETIYKDVLRVQFDKPSVVWIQDINGVIELASERYEGHSLVIPYTIDTRGLPDDITLTDALTVTYTGGEKVIPVSVYIERADGCISSKEYDGAVVDKTTSGKISPPFSLKLGKKAYHIDEEVPLFILNHQPYPIGVRLNASSPMVSDVKSLTVEDVGIVKLRIQQSWFDRFVTKTHYRRPISEMQVSLLVEHDQGTEHIEVPIQWTAYDIEGRPSRIKNERQYQENLLDAQRLYNRYIVTVEKRLLEKAINKVEEALIYSASDVPIRLFHILLLCERGNRADVEYRVNQILRFSHYYAMETMAEFTEILQVLSEWLEGRDVSDVTNQWPLTGYKQLFKARLFDVSNMKFEDCERLYDIGIRQAHLYAQAAALMNKDPRVPRTYSHFYRTLLIWAVNKQYVSEIWMDALCRNNYQLVKYEMINSSSAMRLYGIYQQDDVLRLLVDIMVKEHRVAPTDHSIYLESLRSHHRIRGLEEIYIHTSEKHHLPIDFDVIHVSSLLQRLNADQLKYMIGRYLAIQRTDKNPSLPLMRLYYKMMPEIRLSSEGEEDFPLIRYELQGLMDKHQWEKIGKDYTSLKWVDFVPLEDAVVKRLFEEGYAMLGVEWFVSKLSHDILMKWWKGESFEGWFSWLVDRHHYKTIRYLWYKGALESLSKESLFSIMGKIPLEIYGLRNLIGSYLYDNGMATRTFFEAYLMSIRGPFLKLVEIEESGAKTSVSDVSLMQQVMFKGIVTRVWPTYVLKVFERYMSGTYEKSVVLAVSHYFAAVILIEETPGLVALIKYFERILLESRWTKEETSPISLALLKLYQVYGHNNPEILSEMLKSTVNDGIILPWFADMDHGYLKRNSMRKGAYFSYHSKPNVQVLLHYRLEGETFYRSVRMRHVFFGLHIAYVMAFYLEVIQYYYEEVAREGTREITESGIYLHEVLPATLDDINTYDVINTVTVGLDMGDEETVQRTLKAYIDVKHRISNELTLL